MTGADPGRWPAKYAAKALLGFLMDIRLGAAGTEPAVSVPSPWDAWWACYRAALLLPGLALGLVACDRSCPSCAGRALQLAAARPPGHPGMGVRACGCLLRWAGQMRAPGPRVAWPPVSLSLALIKPGAPAAAIMDLLAPAYGILGSRQLTLTSAGTRRLYPEAYGAGYVRDRDVYLTSGPAQVLILLARRAGTDPSAVKARIRGRIGGDELRNHLHMPDNPGEALADIAQFAGYRELAQLYRRYERDHTARRLAFYRAALGIGPAGADRLPAAG
ncbi:MAG: hypothetical protein ABSA53_18985 [Streptosporangiaceae bacterium]